MLKEMKYNIEARTTFSKGIRMVCEIVVSTFGPFGKNVLIEPEKGFVQSSKKAGDILQDMKVADLFLDEGVQMARESIRNTERLAGDGGTTTAILLLAMVEEGEKMMAAGYNPIRMRYGLKKAAELVKKELEKESFYPSDLKEFVNIAVAACMSMELGELIADAVEKIGKNGMVLVKTAKGISTHVEYKRGMSIQSGYVSSKLCKSGKNEIRFSKPYFLLTKEKITKFSTILPLLEQVAEEKAKLVIIAESIEGEALTMLTLNQQKGVFEVAAVNAAGYGMRRQDTLDDIAVLTGTRVHTLEFGERIEAMTLKDLGRAEEVIIGKDKTDIVGGYGIEDKIEERIQNISHKLEDFEMSAYDRRAYKERIAKLSSGVAEIYVGAATVVEMQEKKIRAQAAVQAVENCLASGCVQGGGIAYHNVIAVLDTVKFVEKEEQMGLEMLKKALKVPFEKIEEQLQIYGEEVEGIPIDSTATLTIALEQAVSTISEWMSAEVLMVSTAPDREDIALMKEGVGIMR